MRHNSLRFITYFLCFLIFGCKVRSEGTVTGNPLTGSPVAVQLMITASSQPSTIAAYKHKPNFLSLFFPSALALPPPSLVDSGGRTVTLNTAWMGIKDIEFKGTETASATENSEIEFPGPYVINLLDSNPGMLGNANVTPPIRRFKASLAVANSTLPTGAPAGLTNHSIYISGNVNGNSFTFRSNEELDYEIAGPNGLSPSENSSLLLSIQIANLFKKINLSSVTNGVTIDYNNVVTATNPCPNIDASATDLYTCLKEGLKTEANLGEDTGGDHELDPSDETVK